MLLSTTPVDLIVHQSGTVELKHVAQLIDRSLSASSLYSSLDFLVLLDDLLVSNGQVILGARGTSDHLDTGSNWGRHHSQVLNDHVGRVGLLLAQSEHLQMLRSDLAQNSLRVLRPQNLQSIVVRPQLLIIHNLVLNLEVTLRVGSILHLTVFAFFNTA